MKESAAAAGVAAAARAPKRGGASLVAYWPFDHDALDYSGNSNDGVLMGLADFTDAGVYGSALDLTQGDGYVDVNSSLLDGEAACSLSYWLRIEDFEPGTASSPCCNAVFAEDGTGPGYLHNNLSFGSQATVGFDVGGGVSNSVTPPQVTPSAWLHLAYTYDTVAMVSRAYLNGQMVDEAPLPAAPSGCGSNVSSQIGAWNNGSQVIRFFHGQIDDLRIYNDALDPAEVFSLFEDAQLISNGRIDLQVKGPLNAQSNLDVRWLGVDQVYQLWPWYRIAGDAQETVFPVPDTVTNTGTFLQMTWSDVDGRGIAASATMAVIDCSLNSYCYTGLPVGAYYSAAITIVNTTGGPLDMTVFWYQDVDLVGSDNDNSARWVDDAFGNSPDPVGGIEVRRDATTVLTIDFSMEHLQVTEYQVLLDALNDGAITNLDDSGLPFGPADFTHAYQVDLSLDIGESGAAVLSGSFNYPVLFGGFEDADFSGWSAVAP